MKERRKRVKMMKEENRAKEDRWEGEEDEEEITQREWRREER